MLSIPLAFSIDFCPAYSIQCLCWNYLEGSCALSSTPFPLKQCPVITTGALPHQACCIALPPRPDFPSELTPFIRYKTHSWIKMLSRKQKLSCLHKITTGSAVMTTFFIARYGFERYHGINNINLMNRLDIADWSFSNGLFTYYQQ